jgi:catalase
MFNKAFPLGLALMSALPAWAAGDEEIPAGEDAATEQIVRMIEANVRAEAKGGKARRDAHPKGHGCVQAEFRVLGDLPEALRAGLFGEARAYPAWIRFSNASGKTQEDSAGDARGMAVKLMGVERSESGTQDFLMINHPVFLVRNAADYVEFQKAVIEGSPARFFFPA